MAKQKTSLMQQLRKQKRKIEKHRAPSQLEQSLKPFSDQHYLNQQSGLYSAQIARVARRAEQYRAITNARFRRRQAAKAQKRKLEEQMQPLLGALTQVTDKAHIYEPGIRETIFSFL